MVNWPSKVDDAYNNLSLKRKNSYLRWLFRPKDSVMVVSGCVYGCMVVSGCVWLCMIVSGCVWLCMVVYGCVWFVYGLCHVCV